MKGVETVVEPKPAVDETPAMLHYSFSDPKEREIRVRLRDTGSLGIVGDDGERRYFAAQFVPDLPATKTESSGDTAVFMVDVSLPSNPDRLNVRAASMDWAQRAGEMPGVNLAFRSPCATECPNGVVRPYPNP